MEFKAIETQEELNRIIGERIQRVKDQEKAKYADYDALKEKAEKYDAAVADYETQLKDLNEKVAGHDQTVAELTAKAAKAETELLKTRIANESGIPYELAGRITGETEEDLRKDAEAFAKFVAPRQPAPPLSSREPSQQVSPESAQYQELLDGLLGQ